MFGKRKIAALVAEFLGTGVLTLLVLSVQRSTIGVPFFVAAAAGLTIAVMTFAFYRVSGAHFNPALTIGLWSSRKVTTARMVLYVIMQFLGAFAAYYLYTYFVKNKLMPIKGDFDAHILVAEIVGTAILAFGYASALFQRFTIGMAAAAAGLAYMIGSIAASSASVGIINPGVALGVQAFILTTYVLGPVIGAVIGVNLYSLLFASRDGVVAASEAAALQGLQDKAGANTEVSQTTVTTIKPARKARATKATAAKSKTTAKRAPRKKN